MRQSAFDFVGNLDTLLAVVIGAMLATIGGLVAEHYEDRIERRRRERDAARFFGEILYSIDTLVTRAIDSQKIGDPWGPVTLRLFKTALREAEVYERNRERLFDLHDGELRKKIHTHVVSEILPLEGMLDGCERLAALAAEIEEREDLPPQRREKIEKISAEIVDMRERALGFIKLEREMTADLCASLQRLASIGAHGAAARPSALSPS